MTLAELIAKYRVDADDTAIPPLASDELVTDWLNEAEEEAAIRASLIHESSNTAITEISVSAGTSVYPLHETVLDITRADFTETGSSEVIHMTLTDRVEQDRNFPEWRTTTDTPTELIQMDKSIRMGCIPETAGTLTIECYRIPRKPMASESDKPEIARIHHRHLIQWALHKNYSRPDTEVYDPNRADRALAEFTRVFGIRPDADVRRSSQANRPLYNKAVW